MIDHKTTIDNSKKDIKFFTTYLTVSDSMREVNKFLQSTACEIIHIECVKEKIIIFYKEIK